jgi:cytochrome c
METRSERLKRNVRELSQKELYMLFESRRRSGKSPVVIALAACAFLLVLLPCLASGCGGGGEQESVSRPTLVQSQVYLGGNIPGGGVVSEEEFGAFIGEVVTPEFPGGITVFDTYGQMQRGDGTIEKQQTKVLLLVHENSKADSERVIGVIDAYRDRFGTPQVMLNTVSVEAQFFQGADVAKPTEREVERFVDEAVEYARDNGREKALAGFTEQGGEFQRGELYIYAYDFSGKVLAHGGDPSLVGQDLIDYTDPNGVKVIQELVKLARGGSGWLDYTWENPQTGEQQAKKGYVVKVDDTWFLGSGTYE